MSLCISCSKLSQGGPMVIAPNNDAEVADRADIVRLGAGFPLRHSDTCSMIPLMTLVTFNHHSRLCSSTQAINLILVDVHGCCRVCWQGCLRFRAFRCVSAFIALIRILCLGGQCRSFDRYASSLAVGCIGSE